MLVAVRWLEYARKHTKRSCIFMPTGRFVPRRVTLEPSEALHARSLSQFEALLAIRWPPSLAAWLASSSRCGLLLGRSASAQSGSVAPRLPWTRVQLFATDSSLASPDRSGFPFLNLVAEQHALFEPL